MAMLKAQFKALMTAAKAESALAGVEQQQLLLLLPLVKPSGLPQTIAVHKAPTPQRESDPCAGLEDIWSNCFAWLKVCSLT